MVAQIVATVKERGDTLVWANRAAGYGDECEKVLQQTRGAKKAVVASTTMVSPNAPKVEAVETVFVAAPADQTARQEHSAQVFNVWLAQALASGKYVPSPKVRVCEGGLGKINEALNALREGVSGEKLVVDV